jgi:hypothetical protein
MPTSFSQGQLEALAGVLVDIDGGLTHGQIGHLLRVHHLIDDYVSGTSKRVRLINAFALSLNTLQSDAGVRKIVESACDPSRFLAHHGLFESYRQRVNEAVAFVGWEVGPDRKIPAAKAVTTLPEAQRRAKELRQDLLSRDIHPDVLAFCTPGLLANDYFHMVLEATKSVFAKIRAKTGLDLDGAE